MQSTKKIVALVCERTERPTHKKSVTWIAHTFHLDHIERLDWLSHTMLTVRAYQVLYHQYKLLFQFIYVLYRFARLSKVMEKIERIFLCVCSECQMLSIAIAFYFLCVCVWNKTIWCQISRPYQRFIVSSNTKKKYPYSLWVWCGWIYVLGNCLRPKQKRTHQLNMVEK